MNTFKKANILIPKEGTNLEKWSVVACDQYTSEVDYWEDVKNITEGFPSTLNLIFPEVYLSEGDKRIEKINKTMDEYLDSGIFDECLNSLIYVERKQKNGKIRHGIIGAVDLEDYDFNKGSKSLIRATEGTVLERIPPRVKIRQEASLELPHIMILINDEKNTVINPADKGNKLYDFELMKDGGHLSGYLLPDIEADKVISALSELEKNAEDGLVYAVGDGNHSLATAKTCWENIKKGLTKEEMEYHPARFCLVEIENIYDSAIEFEPIHRVVFDVEPEKIIEEFKKFYPETSETETDGHRIEYISKNKSGVLFVKNSGCQIAVGTLQKFLDAQGAKVDYIHGDDVVKKLAQKDKNIGFLLPKMEKSDLFKTVISDGALPRKTFSMGEACDKRFYFEAKKIL